MNVFDVKMEETIYVKANHLQLLLEKLFSKQKNMKFEVVLMSKELIQNENSTDSSHNIFILIVLYSHKKPKMKILALNVIRSQMHRSD